MIDFDNLPSDRIKWPWCKMGVGETIMVTDYRGKTKTQVQRMVTNYGTGSGKKFKSKTSDGILYVKRIS